MALRCLRASLKLDPDHPRAHEQSIELGHVLKEADDVPAKTMEVLNGKFGIDVREDLKAANEVFRARHSSSSAHILSVIKTRKLLGDNAADCEKEVISLLSMDDVTFTVAGTALAALRTWRSTQIELFKSLAHEKWPEVTFFAP